MGDLGAQQHDRLVPLPVPSTPRSRRAADEVGRDAAGLHILTPDDCRTLLGTVRLGRVGVSAGALPRVLPVGFTCVGGRVLFGVPWGSMLDRATRDAVVSFEADDLSPELATGWSVVGVGLARDATPDEALAALRHEHLRRWVDDVRHRIVALTFDELTGRRVSA